MRIGTKTTLKCMKQTGEINDKANEKTIARFYPNDTVMRPV